MSSASRNRKKIQKVLEKLQQIYRLLDELELSVEVAPSVQESEEVDVDYSPDMDIVVARARRAAEELLAKETADFPGTSVVSESKSEGAPEAEGFLHDLEP